MSPGGERPVLFVTGHAPADRLAAFALLAQRERVEFALYGGRLAHGPDSVSGSRADPGLRFPHRYVRQSQIFALAASGRYRAVVCGVGGRVALPGAWAGARAARVPLLLWSALWAHPRSLAHAASYLAMARLYRSADAVVTYGPHVSDYARRQGARNVHIAPQAVDNAFWGAAGAAPQPPWPGSTSVVFLFVGRPVREKGLQVLLAAWRASGLGAPGAALVLVGMGSLPPWVPADGAAVLSEAQPGPDRTLDVDFGLHNAASVTTVGAVEPVELRNFYAAAHVLVMPSVRTPTFREPWGLVANEAMNQGLPVIASDAVGAAAGGLIRNEGNGLVVPAGQAQALADAMRRLAADGDLRQRLGAAGARDVLAYTPSAWAEGFASALASVGAGVGQPFAGAR